MGKQNDRSQRIAAILKDRRSPLTEQVKAVSDVRKLSREIRERVRDELGEEFSSKGLGPEDEPNSYGLELEDLTDALGLAWETEDPRISRV